MLPAQMPQEKKPRAIRRRKRETMSERINIPMLPEFKARLERIADESGQTLADITRDSLEYAMAVYLETGRIQFPQPNRLVQMCGKICAGDGITVVPTPGIFVRAPLAMPVSASTYALTVQGDSMDGLAGHSIVDGMIAFFDKDKPPYPNCVAHVEWEDKGGRVCTVKKLRYREGEDKVILRPTNPRYQEKVKKFSEIIVKGVLITAVPSETQLVVIQ